MKEFNGSVVIIDPAKFAKPDDLGTKIDTKLTKISPKLGLHGYFFVNLGRESMYVHQYKVDNVKDYYSQGTETWVKGAIMRAFNGQVPKSRKGQVSVDSGTIGVFLLSDIEAYNPEMMSKLKAGVDYVLLQNYHGRIGYTRDKYGIIHFYGTGNNNFYTL